MNQYLVNPLSRSGPSCRSLFSEASYEAVRVFYQKPHAAPPTPLLHLPGLAARLSVREILVKNESKRFGLNAFKLLGVQYAVERLKQAGRLAGSPRLVCATDGNHGRAVAHVARKYGCSARIYVPGYTVPARIEAIRAEGAEVIVVDSGYDAAIRESAHCAEHEGATLVSDTSWPGYEEIPGWIMAGYTQILNEAAAQWLPGKAPDIVLVQVGVGGLAGAVVSWLCHHYGENRPTVIACEPTGAACLLESFRAGKLVELEGSLPTIMAGLRCGQVSALAWPVLAGAVDAFVAIDDEYVTTAMKMWAEPQAVDPAVEAGESGACGLGTLLAILNDEDLRPVREMARLGPSSRVLVFNTEGATDPEMYARVVRGTT